jgi:peptide/nickel transport system substrate-binding protein
MAGILERRILKGLLALGLWLAATAPVAAQELRIGFKAAVDGSDPHQTYTPNRNVQLHVYEPLVRQDEHIQPLPGLAESWQVVDPTTWEFRLRRGVMFQDGAPFTADDAMFSIKRAQTIEGIRTYRVYLRDIASMEAPDAHTLVIHTRAPAPLLPAGLAAIAMVSARAADGATEADFNGGRAAIGTGPYRWVRFTPGQDVVLERNPTYWGDAEPWSRVIFRFVPNDSARVAALLAGDLDVIDTVAPELYARVRENERTQLLTTTSSFTLYLQLDQKRERTPYATGADGQPLPRNPLLDRRVRQAISLALNRVAIAERAMAGGAEAAGQFMAAGFGDHVPALPPPAADPAGARALLAEAGYPQGFGLTLACTNDRYAGDTRVCQTVAQMLTAVGIRTQVEALPATIFFRRGGNARTESEFSAQMSIYSSLVGLGSENMTALVRTIDAPLGLGVANRSNYTNPALDQLLARVDAAFDPDRRTALVRQATELAIADQAITPIFFMKGSWGLRRGLTMQPRGDQYTFATGIRATP